MSLVSELKRFVATPLEYWSIAHDKKGVERRGRVPVFHDLGGPADANDLQLAKKLLGKFAVPITRLAAKHDGFTLYRGYSRSQCGFRMFPIRRWSAAKREAASWLEELSDEQDPHHLRTAIPIAEVPDSANYFFIPIEGRYAGKVIYFGHDGYERSVYAKDFEAFIRKIMKPSELVKSPLNDTLIYIDPKTRLQWNPRKVAKPEQGD